MKNKLAIKLVGVVCGLISAYLVTFVTVNLLQIIGFDAESVAVSAIREEFQNSWFTGLFLCSIHFLPYIVGIIGGLIMDELQDFWRVMLLPVLTILFNFVYLIIIFIIGIFKSEDFLPALIVFVLVAGFATPVVGPVIIAVGDVIIGIVGGLWD